MLVTVGAILNVPETALAPDHAPVAVHAVVLLDDQVSVLLPPEMIEPGFAEIEIVGGDVAEEEDEEVLALDAELDATLDEELDALLLCREYLYLLVLLVLLVLVLALAAATLIEKVGIVV